MNRSVVGSRPTGCAEQAGAAAIRRGSLRDAAWRGRPGGGRIASFRVCRRDQAPTWGRTSHLRERIPVPLPPCLGHGGIPLILCEREAVAALGEAVARRIGEPRYKLWFERHTQLPLRRATADRRRAQPPLRGVAAKDLRRRPSPRPPGRCSAGRCRSASSSIPRCSRPPAANRPRPRSRAAPDADPAELPPPAAPQVSKTKPQPAPAVEAPEATLVPEPAGRAEQPRPGAAGAGGGWASSSSGRATAWPTPRP